MTVIVTIDLFSALTDTRTGAAHELGAIAGERGWDVDGPTLYATWDRHNKAGQAATAPDSDVSFASLSTTALEAAYAELGLPVEHAGPDRARLHATVGAWPLWPDIADGVRALAAAPGVEAVGVLSNVDDDLFARTAAAALLDPRWALTSQRLGAYKPHREIYHRAHRVAADAGTRLVHVAASARDVRGALEAGIAVVRLARPGHAIDPAGPAPGVEITDAGDLPAAVGRAAGSTP